MPTNLKGKSANSTCVFYQSNTREINIWVVMGVLIMSLRSAAMAVSISERCSFSLLPGSPGSWFRLVTLVIKSSLAGNIVCPLNFPSITTETDYNQRSRHTTSRFGWLYSLGPGKDDYSLHYDKSLGSHWLAQHSEWKGERETHNIAETLLLFCRRNPVNHVPPLFHSFRNRSRPIQMWSSSVTRLHSSSGAETQ